MSALQPTELPPEAPQLSKRAKWRKLATIADVRQALASVIKKTYDGNMPVERAAVCINGLRALGKVIVDSQGIPAQGATDPLAGLSPPEILALARKQISQ